MSSVVSRRITITIQQSHDESIRSQLFSTFAAYGVVEAFSCEDNANYDQSVVTVQFQKLSAAEQLQADAIRSGRPWHVLFQPAAPHTSPELLVSSRRPLNRAALTELAGAEGEAAEEAPANTAASTSSASRVPKGSRDFFEEKLLRAPGRSTTGAASIAVAKDDSVWAPYTTRNVAVVQSYCVGPYIGLLRFKDTHTANAFIVGHQQSLAGKQDTYVQFIPPAPAAPTAHQSRSAAAAQRSGAPAPLHTAVHGLLTYQPVSALREGDTLRGYLVEARSTAVCVVDAGMVDDTAPHHSRTVLLVETHTNFLKARLKDEVLIQVRSVAAPNGKMAVQATLIHVLSEDAAAGGHGRLANSRGQQQPLLPQQPFMTGSRGGNVNQTQGNTPASSQDSMAFSQLALSSSQLQSGAAPAATKKLASRLFQSIQRRKQEGTLLGGGSASGERMSAFPPGLHPFAQLLVRVDRVEAGGDCAQAGLHATILGYATAEPGQAARLDSWPVFVPAALVPSSADGTGDWQSFAVAGERMAVALLYAVAVGDSRATLRCVASKLEPDMRRATAVAATYGAASVTELTRRHSTPLLLGADDEDESGGGGGGSSDQLGAVAALRVGEALSAAPVREVVAGDVGTGGPRAHFPAWVVLPTSGRPTDVLCLLPNSRAPPSLLAADSALRALPAMELVVAEIVHDGPNGNYAVMMDGAAFEAAEEKRQEAVRRQQQANRDAVKRRLAAVLGEDAVSGLGDSFGEADAKKPRTK